MLTKRIIPCLDVKDGRVVKGVSFVELRAARDPVESAKAYELQGAGEIRPTSMDRDGTKDGYDLELTSAVSRATSIPVIASGGAGTLEHVYEAFTKGLADAALAASIFHFGVFTIPQTKEYLNGRGIRVRPPEA